MEVWWRCVVEPANGTAGRVVLPLQPLGVSCRHSAISAPMQSEHIQLGDCAVSMATRLWLPMWSEVASGEHTHGRPELHPMAV